MRKQKRKINKKVNYKKIKIIPLFFVVVAILVWYVWENYVIITNTICNEAVGILDGRLSKVYDNIELGNQNATLEKKSTHGDEMIKFAKACQENIIIYYYDASDENGIIHKENIIAGLNWMYESKIKKINISLSSKQKSKELEKWIIEHKDVKVFVSYNNNRNTYDYPAMYEGTVASGSDPRILYKSTDVQYCSNKIILFNTRKIAYFKGNSYLSVYSMLKSKY